MLIPIIQSILLLRWRQVIRNLRSVGWILLVALPMLLIYGLGILDMIQQNFALGTVLLFLLIWGVHSNRQDRPFLESLDFPVRTIFAVEYTAILAPFTFFLITLFQNWQLAFLAHLLAIIIAQIKYRNIDMKISNLQLPLFAKVEAFEWTTAFRSYPLLQWLFFPSLLLGYYLGGIPIFLLLIMMMSVSFYEYYEAKDILDAMQLNGGILSRKLIATTMTVHTLFSLHYLVFLVFHWAYWYLILLTILLIQLILHFNIYYKYAHYLPNRRKNQNQTVSSFFIIGMVVPFFTPVSVIGLFYYWRKARKRINYFYANN